MRERQQESEKKSNFAERLKSARQALALTQDDLGSRWGIEGNYIYMLEAEKKAFPKKWELAVVELENEVRQKYAPLRSNAQEVREVLTAEEDYAPAVSWASAGSGGNYSDVAEFMNERVSTDCPDPNKYALVVEGESMEPVLRPGDRIVIAPNREAANGDIVVARLSESGEVLLKVYHCSGVHRENVTLTSYNPVFPPLQFKRDQFRFIHPVWEMKRRMIRPGPHYPRKTKE